MPNPGDEWAAGDIPPEPEMTPEKLREDLQRLVCRFCEMVGYHTDDCLGMAILSAWETDRIHIEALEQRLEAAKGAISLDGAGGMRPHYSPPSPRRRSHMGILSEKMEFVGQEAYLYAPEVYALEARIEALASDKAAMRLEIVTIIGMYGDHMHPRVKQALEAVAAAYPSAALAASELHPDVLSGEEEKP